MITILYSYVVIPIIYCLLPTIQFTYLNIRIVTNLSVAPITIVSNTSKCMVRQVQRMLVTQLIILILSGLPLCVQTVYSVATIFAFKDDNRIAVKTLIVHLTRLSFYLNFISVFYIYILMSKEFRKIFSTQTIVTTHASVVVIPDV